MAGRSLSGLADKHIYGFFVIIADWNFLAADEDAILPNRCYGGDGYDERFVDA